MRKHGVNQMPEVKCFSFEKISAPPSYLINTHLIPHMRDNMRKMTRLATKKVSDIAHWEGWSWWGPFNV